MEMAAETTTMTIRTLIGFCASVAWLLVTIIGSQVMLLGGRAIGCAINDRGLARIDER